MPEPDELQPIWNLNGAGAAFLRVFFKDNGVKNMCRLLGVVADAPSPLSSLLAEDLEPFLLLACEHKDGWGVAYRDERGLVQIIKDTENATGNEQMRKCLDDCVTDMAFLHLRMASPQLAVSMGNTHPFGDTRAALAHNGEIRPAQCLDPVIPPALLAEALGETDSERYFLAVRNRLDRGARPEQAILRTTDDIHRAATSVISLNCMLLTPDGLFTYAEHDPDSEVISRRGSGFFGLSYRRDAEKTVVASEGWPQPQPQWQTLPERHVLQIKGNDRAMTVHS